MENNMVANIKKKVGRYRRKRNTYLKNGTFLMFWAKEEGAPEEAPS
jgi:hypothetical protein